MNTPICDFVERYVAGNAARLHVPGHKGRGLLGVEARDITEISGTETLIAESEANAAALFGTAATFYSEEGSSLCIRAMLHMAMTLPAASPFRGGGGRGAPQSATLTAPHCGGEPDINSTCLPTAVGRWPVGPVGHPRPLALAARNAHKAFLYAAALCDFDVEWLYPEATDSVCACPVSPAALAARLDGMAAKPFCVYVTSPDYLGGVQDIRGLADVCHARNVPLLVDNAHGAYLKFLPESRHPIDLGADMCCDSAHKTLPALTGAAYLHISNTADPRWRGAARAALALFASTSPSWLILQSLDACNARLSGDWPAALAQTAGRVAALRHALEQRGFRVASDEPMKLTLVGDGVTMTNALRASGVECEYADRGHVVLMFSPDNPPEDFARVAAALTAPPPWTPEPPRLVPHPPRAMTIREAVFAPSEWVPVREALGRVCAAPTVACPPAVPIAVSGEILCMDSIEALIRNGIDAIRVVAADA